MLDRPPRRSSPVLVAVLLVAANVASRAGRDGPDWPPLPDAPADAAAAADGAAAEVLRLETTVDDRRLPKRQIYEVLRRVRVLDEAGREYGVTEIPLQLPFERLDAVRARSVCPSGDARPARIEEPEQRRGGEARAGIVRVHYAEAAPGCVLDLWYRLVIKEIWRFTWYPQEWIPVRSARLLWRPWRDGPPFDFLILPATGVELTAAVTGADEEDDEDEPEVRFTVEQVPALVEEPFSPPLTTLASQVLLFYRGEERPASFWSGHGRRINASLARFDRREQDVRERAAELTAGLEEPSDKARAVYAFVQQHVVNTGDLLRPGQPPYDSDLVTGNASYVMSCRCGGLLEVNRLFVVLARAAGVDAGLAYAVRRGRGTFRSNLPLWRFDEELCTYWDDDDGWTFVSPGRMLYPFGMVPAHVHGQEALVVAADRVLARTIPVAPATQNRIDIDGRLLLERVDDAPRLRGPFAVSAEGEPAILLERALRRGSDADARERVGRVLELLLPGARAVRAELETGRDGDARVELRGSLELPLAGAHGDAVSVELGRLRAPLDDLFTADERHNPVLLDYAKLETERWEIELGSDWAVVEAPRVRERLTDAGRYRSGYAVEGDGVVFTRSWRLDALAIGPAQYPELAGLFDAAREFDTRALRLRSTGASAR